MNREQTIEAIRVMQAFVDGSEVQAHTIIGHWVDVSDPCWNFDDIVWRIKPAAKLRPWTADEVPLGAQCRKIGDSKRFLIVRTSDESMRSEWAENCEHSTDGGKTWLPCGVVEESK